MVMVLFLSPHWQALSVMLQPAPVMAVWRQLKEQDGIWEVRSAIDWAWATAAKMAAAAEYVNFMFPVEVIEQRMWLLGYRVR